jgi:hypothetical protein
METGLRRWGGGPGEETEDLWEGCGEGPKPERLAQEDEGPPTKFHIVQHLTNAVDLVRRTENRALREAGDNSLVGSKHV